MATRRGSISKRVSSSPTVNGPATSNESPLRVMVTGKSGAVALSWALRALVILAYTIDLMTTTASAIDRKALSAWYRRNRDRSAAIFDLLAPEAYYDRPIALRHPVVFYDGHLPAFSFNTLVKKGLGRPGIDARLEALFARGI